MQVVNAGTHKLIQLELEAEVIEGIAKQAGFECRIEEQKRFLSIELRASNRRAPLLLFDAADPANLGWFSRCQFYVDGQTGLVMQTPISVANVRDRSGRAQPDALRVQLTKELPASFRLPGRNPVTENLVYSVLVSFLNAILQTGVGVCGGPVVRPLAGRTEFAGERN
jgi:hypothetical protein